MSHVGSGPKWDLDNGRKKYSDEVKDYTNVVSNGTSRTQIFVMYKISHDRSMYVEAMANLLQS